MKEFHLLYQIKMLEKEMARAFFHDFNENAFPPTPTQMQIIAYILKHRKDIIYQRDLEKMLNLRRATVSGVLKTMEKNHVIKRVVDEKDTRQKQIMIEPEMEKMFVLHLQKIEAMERQLTKNVTKEEQRIFIEIIHKMQENLSISNEIKERKKKCSS